MGGGIVSGAPPVPPGHVALDGLGAPDLGQALYGNGSAGNPLNALERPVKTIMASRAVVSWWNPTIRLWRVMCGGRPASIGKAVIQGYVGDTVDLSVDVYRMLETMNGIDSLVFTPCGLAGIALPLTHHLSILVHAL